MNKKHSLQGMEHLKSEIYQNDGNLNEPENKSEHTIIKIELIQIMVIMLIICVSIVAIVFIDKSTNFLQTLAEGINNWI